MNKIFALAGVVIKELYRRKDFYVLFIVTILICLVMASVNIFNDAKIVRYLKEICLLLVWISSLVIAVTTTASSSKCTGISKEWVVARCAFSSFRSLSPKYASAGILFLCQGAGRMNSTWPEKSLKPKIL